MEFGICQLSIVPVRKSRSDTAEIITQLLFGERAIVLDRIDNWIMIECEWDGYQGWIDFKQLNLISKADYDVVTSFGLNNQISQAISINEETYNITLGASLPLYCNSEFELGNKQIKVQAIPPYELFSSEKAIEISKRYLNAPYLWGGRSPFGIDCSGLTQLVYKFFNIRLRRDASQQVLQGEEVSFLAETIPGDLAFFESASGKITHVGVLLSTDKIIHAHGHVRIDTIDRKGIFNKDQDKYTHNLRIIKRIANA